jgi:hypothetical protein
MDGKAFYTVLAMINIGEFAKTGRVSCRTQGFVAEGVSSLRMFPQRSHSGSKWGAPSRTSKMDKKGEQTMQNEMMKNEKSSSSCPSF